MTASAPDNEAIFHAARDIPDPDRRREYVREACGGDDARAAHVEAMLAAADAPDSLLDRPLGHAPLATIDQPRIECAGTVIGAYKLLQQIGEGGMGTVWMAQQTEPVKRLVALKLIKAGMDSRQVIARFEAERQALALMDHPNIAKVLDGGTTPSGRPYFVMDLVKGVPITKYCDEHHVTPKQRLELFIPVCHAIQHAHQKGIIHRDLKPSNVLVALYDGKPVPKVIDFGVAKAAGQPLTDKTLVTGFGNIVGTLEYMSPEQAEINQLDIDTRSDIYSLGVLLYELLAGSPPFTRKDLEKAGVLEMLRVIREQEPSKPSTKLSTADGLPTLAANRGTEPSKLSNLVRGELDWIVMKALEKDRSRRYETANGFAMDVQRYLADEAVLACPPSVGYRLGKFVRRNKGPVLATALVLLVLVGGIIGTTSGLIRARRAEDVAQDRLSAEKEAKQRAVVNLQKAMAAVDQFLTRVGEKELEAVPGMEVVRKGLLQDALRFYEEFLKENNADPALRLETGNAWRRTGDIRLWLSDHAGAEDDFRKAISLLGQLVAEHPQEASFQWELAQTHRNLSRALRNTGRQREAEQTLRRAIDLVRDLISRYPGVLDYQWEVLRLQGSLGVVYVEEKRYVEAETALRSALALGAELDRNTGLARERPELHYQHLRNSIEGMTALGSVLRAVKRPGEADKVYAEAAAMMDKVLAINPNRPWNRTLHANLLEGRCHAMRQLGQLEKAKDYLRQAVAIDEKLAADFPTVERYQQQKALRAEFLKTLEKK